MPIFEASLVHDPVVAHFTNCAQNVQQLKPYRLINVTDRYFSFTAPYCATIYSFVSGDIGEQEEKKILRQRLR